jgi:hypothetical protein
VSKRLGSRYSVRPVIALGQSEESQGAGCHARGRGGLGLLTRWLSVALDNRLASDYIPPRLRRRPRESLAPRLGRRGAMLPRRRVRSRWQKPRRLAGLGAETKLEACFACNAL